MAKKLLKNYSVANRVVFISYIKGRTSQGTDPSTKWAESRASKKYWTRGPCQGKRIGLNQRMPTDLKFENVVTGTPPDFRISTVQSIISFPFFLL